jgi:hypothetical protein
MAQFARPISTLDTGNWTPVNAPTCHEATDEVTPNGDTDYAEADDASTILKVGLGSVVDPLVHTGHWLRFTAKAIGSKGGEKLDITLAESGLELVELFSNQVINRGSHQLYEIELSEAEAALINDYGALEIWSAVDTLGGGENIRITQAEFQVPDAGAYCHGLKVQGEGELALCDVGSHPLRIRKGGVTYGIELVDTGDPNASRIRIQTGAGLRAIRKYT